jgi:predicted hydrocarbon binding protein
MDKVKGGKISSKLAFVREVYGQEMLAKLIDSFPPQDQLQLKIVLETKWYSLDLYEQVILAVCKIAGNGDQAVYAQMGRHSAELAFNGAYRAFRAKNPVDLSRRFVLMHKLRNDPAETEVSVEEGRCIVKVTKPRSTVEICRVSKAFWERSVELAGGRNVEVREPRCMGRGDLACLFEISWKD